MDNQIVLSYREVLKNKSGVYCFINTVKGKLYVGSAKDLYLRFVIFFFKKKKEHKKNIT